MPMQPDVHKMRPMINEQKLLPKMPASKVRYSCSTAHSTCSFCLEWFSNRPTGAPAILFLSLDLPHPMQDNTKH
eukprot:5648290-Amphidinium_carterae.1